MINENHIDKENKVTPSENVEKKNSAFAGLPIDESSEVWMNDDVAPIVESDEESEKENPEDISVVEKETSVKTSENVSKKPSFAGLPIDEAIDSWMDDNVGIIQESDEEESKNQVENIAKVSENVNDSSSSDMPCKNPTLIKIDDSKDIPVVEKGTSVTTLENISKKPSFAGLPIDEAIDSWMDDDVGIIQESDEEESEGQVEKINKVSEEEKKSSSNDIPSKNKTPKTNDTKHKATESKQEENTKSKPQTTKKNKIEKDSISDKTMPEKVDQSTKEKSKSNIDSILDDWLKGSEEDANDDSIPDELPDIGDDIPAKEKKVDVKTLKSSKVNAVLSDMSRLSNIMDKDSNRGV